MPRFDSILVANRGEIARRILRTCRGMGLSTVAAYSDADARAPFVRDADVAVRLGPASAADSYLNIDAVIDAARRTGAGAIHPGYGFLAERSDFAAAVRDANLVFVGPSPQTLAIAGSKAEARRRVVRHDVPVLPGYDGDDQSDGRFAVEAERIGYPVLVKASAGGGGKGIQIVRGAEALPAALAQARRLAHSAFGDGHLLIERYVAAPRHLEVQIFGDGHGRVVHLHERECTIQRRFQKIIEESPSPALSPSMRAELCAAGIRVGEALGYENAGTVEFILDETGEFYFLEVNARLQVEHPVTEMRTGLDLVALQILVAQGWGLPFEGDGPAAMGHAIECRICAEDPARGDLPVTGRLAAWELPELPGVRIDAGVEAGSQVPIHYDSLVAKLIAHAPTRPEALLRMSGALARLQVAGLTTNVPLLRNILRDPDFEAGRFTTHFLEEKASTLRRFEIDEGAARDAALAAALFGVASPPRDLPALRPGWRNSRFRPARVELVRDDIEVVVEYTWGRDGTIVACVNEAGSEHATTVTDVARDAASVTFARDGIRARHRVVRHADQCWVHGPRGAFAFTEPPPFSDLDAAAATGDCLAPTPGKIVGVDVEPGQTVAKGQGLVVLEAMKMEHTVVAPRDAVVVTVHGVPGDVVHAGAPLVTLSEPTD